MAARSDRDSEGKPLPHDPPDQQADSDSEVPDPWSVPPAGEESGDDVPRTDEAGTGRKGQDDRTASPTYPEPQEPSG